MSEATGRLPTALADRYKIERRLGEGGMATVYLAEDIKHDRRVALKVLKPELAAVLGAERFVQEIKTTASLQHPNILPLFDSGEADSFLYYAMPFIEGETLREKLDREKQLSIEDAVAITTDVAEALQAAHEEGVIHRDIKPENILLHKGRAMVADFGIALAVSRADGRRLREIGVNVGSPRYMSPEQVTGDHAVGARSDVYSLGAMAYEMLMGESPHAGDSVQAITDRIPYDTPVPIAQSRKSVPSNVDAAVQRALAKNPEDRFKSARQFKAALANPRFTLRPTREVRRVEYEDLEQFALANPGWLSVTIIVACGVLAVFTLLGPESELGVRLYAWGAKVNEEIQAGAWWRLLSSAFLHGGFEHLLFNAYALFVIGSLTERAFGPARFITIFVVSAVAGAFASLLFVDEMSVGASGGIFGLMGAGLLSLKRGHQAVNQVLSGKHMAMLALWAGYTLFIGFTEPGVDNAAHVGGMVAGAAVAAALPRGRPAQVSALVSTAALVWAVVGVTGTAKLVNAAATFDRGVELAEAGQIDEAEAAYTEALPLPAAYLNRGVIRLNRGDVYGALLDFDSALAGSSGGEVQELASANRGIVLAELGRYQEAIAPLDRALQTQPDNPDLHFYLGLSYGGVGRGEDALANLQRSVELVPDNPLYQVVLGGATLDFGDPEQAVAPLARAVELAPQYFTHLVYGVALQENGEVADAVAQYRIAVGLEPDSAEAHFRLGQGLREAGQLDDALASLREAVRLDPQLTEAELVLADAEVQSAREERPVGPQMRISAIVLTTRDVAEQVLERLNAGADFATLAATFTTGPGKDAGGDLGYFGPGELMSALEPVAVKLEVGQHSDIIETEMGLFIIKKTDGRRPARDSVPR